MGGPEVWIEAGWTDGRIQGFFFCVFVFLGGILAAYSFVYKVSRVLMGSRGAGQTDMFGSSYLPGVPILLLHLPGVEILLPYIAGVEILLLYLTRLEIVLGLDSFSSNMARQQNLQFAQFLADMIGVCGIDTQHVDGPALYTIHREEFADEEFPGAFAVRI